MQKLQCTRVDHNEFDDPIPFKPIIMHSYLYKISIMIVLTGKE